MPTMTQKIQLNEIEVRRFWTKVLKRNGCWEWTSAIASTGYGVVNIRGKVVGAHRMSWIISYGSIPDGLFVCHRCDNKKCVRPGHLFIGTQADNIEDCIKKGRMSDPPVPPFGEKHCNSKISDVDVTSIRSSWVPNCRGLAKALAQKYGISINSVRGIALGFQRTGKPRDRKPRP